MNYLKIEKDNMLNGPGIRVILWLAGCDHMCEKCHNVETWDCKTGYIFDDKAKNELFEFLSKPYCTGLTLTGGDPLFIKNRVALLSLLSEIKEKFPDKTIWCWTGYTIEELLYNFENNNSVIYYILSNIDVLVDGKFDYKTREADLKKENSSSILKYRGSSNQRVIDIKKTLKEKRLTEYEY